MTMLEYGAFSFATGFVVTFLLRWVIYLITGE